MTGETEIQAGQEYGLEFPDKYSKNKAGDNSADMVKVGGQSQPPEIRGRFKQFQNRFMQQRSVIGKEFTEAGFRITGKVDFLPGYSMWRTYVLKK